MRLFLGIAFLWCFLVVIRPRCFIRRKLVPISSHSTRALGPRYPTNQTCMFTGRPCRGVWFISTCRLDHAAGAAAAADDDATTNSIASSRLFQACLPRMPSIVVSPAVPTQSSRHTLGKEQLHVFCDCVFIVTVFFLLYCKTFLL